MTVWVDGEHVDLPLSHWTKEAVFQIYRSTRLLAIRCYDQGAIGGILASGPGVHDTISPDGNSHGLRKYLAYGGMLLHTEQTGDRQHHGEEECLP